MLQATLSTSFLFLFLSIWYHFFLFASIWYHFFLFVWYYINSPLENEYVHLDWTETDGKIDKQKEKKTESTVLIQRGMIIPSSEIRLPKWQRRSFRRKSLSVDFDEDTMDDETTIFIIGLSNNWCQCIRFFFRSFQQIIL